MTVDVQNKARGRVTIPTNLDVVPETIEVLKRWGADAIRDWIEKIRTAHTGTNPIIQCDTDIAGSEYKRLTNIVHDNLGFQSFVSDAGVKAEDHFIGTG